MMPLKSMLFCPATQVKQLYSAHIYKPDAIIYDLEDAVAYAEKDSARDLLCQALLTVDFKGVPIFARVNALNTEFGETDVRDLVKSGLRLIRLPMCESKKDIEKLDNLLTELEKKYQIPLGLIKVQAALETPLGVFNSLEIACASPRVISISFGAEDFTRSLGVDRTKQGEELRMARHQVVTSAHLAKVLAIDTVFTDLNDEEGFKNETIFAKTIGFSGKSCIHPSQIAIVHAIFTPTEEEIKKALKIIEASENVTQGGVIVVDGKMVDIPVIQKAQRILEKAGFAKGEK